MLDEAIADGWRAFYDRQAKQVAEANSHVNRLRSKYLLRVDEKVRLCVVVTLLSRGPQTLPAASSRDPE